MEVDCEGCAGCCIDWRPLVDGTLRESEAPVDGEEAPEDGSGATAAGGTRGRFDPLDDAGNLVPLTREEVRAFVDAGLGDALRPRLFAAAEDGASVVVDGVAVAAIGDRPAFVVGPRRPPKPVGPFGADPAWLRTCAFLDPATLQCRIHGGDLYPSTCAGYPGENLVLDAETECERVERAGGGERLLDDEPPDDATPRFGPGAVGTTVFAHPAPERRPGVVERLEAGSLTREDRAEFVAVAAASSPGTVAIGEEHYERTRDRILDADSWVGRAVDDWRERAGDPGAPAPDPGVAAAVEDDEGAPATPGWDAVESQ